MFKFKYEDLFYAVPSCFYNFEVWTDVLWNEEPAKKEFEKTNQEFKENLVKAWKSVNNGRYSSVVRQLARSLKNDFKPTEERVAHIIFAPYCEDVRWTFTDKKMDMQEVLDFIRKEDLTAKLSEIYDKKFSSYLKNKRYVLPHALNRREHWSKEGIYHWFLSDVVVTFYSYLFHIAKVYVRTKLRHKIKMHN